MKFFKVTKLLLDKKLLIKLYFLLPVLIISIFLEVLGLSMVPILISAISSPDKVLTLLREINFFPLKEFVIFLQNSSKIAFILTFTFIFGFIFIIKNIISVMILYYENWLSMKIKISLTTRLAQFYFFSPYMFHLESTSSQLIRNLNNETKVVGEYFKSFITSAREMFIIACIILTLISFYPAISIISFLFLLFSTIIFHKFTKNRILKISKILFVLREKFITLIQEGFGSIKSTLILQREKAIYKNLNNLTSTKEILEFKNNFILKLPKVYLEVVFILTFCLIIFLTINLYQDSNEIFSILAILGVAMTRLVPSFNNLSANLLVLKSQAVSVDYMVNEFEKKNNTKNYDKKNNLNKRKNDLYGDIIFNNVSFKYQNSKKYIFKDLNLRINKGEIIAITGDSGVGKTTLVDLLLGLLEPNEGKIFSNNINVNKEIFSWRKILGYVPQEVVLINNTIKKNITVGLKESLVNKKQLKNIIKKTNIAEFMTAEDGKFINIGERGARLSGGQKQRIGIARALYKDPKVIIFDEATSALDKKNEDQILKDIKMLSKNRIIIFITHKIENLVFADKIFCIDRFGKIKQKNN
jgi:ABC-type multidrug transport system fused ATPase/permease subunit